MKRLMISITVTMFLAGGVHATEISIGTGGKKGTYYAHGKILCRAVERFSTLDCNRISTKGYRENVAGLLRGEYDLILIPSHGLPNEQPHQSLRYVLSLNPEAITILVKPGLDINKFSNLKNEHIAVLGNRTKYYFEQLVSGVGWQRSQYSRWEVLNYKSPIENFCSGSSKALVLITGHPSGYTEKAISKCDAKILNLQERNIRDFVESKKVPYFSMVEVPDIYWQRTTVATVGLPTTIVSRVEVSNDIVSSFVKAIFRDIKWLKKSHESFSQLDRNEMSGTGRALPYHPGAVEYYQSADLQLNQNE